MSEEQMKVLEMLANGTVSVEEANELLEAMNEPAPRARERQESHWERQDVEDAIGIDLDDLREALAETGRSLGRVKVKLPKVKVMGFEDKIGSSPRFDRLVKLGMFGVSAEQMKELRERFPDLTFDEVVKAAQFGVSPSFIDEVKAAGLGDLEFREIVKLKMFGISPSYIKDMQDAGVLDDLPDAEDHEYHEDHEDHEIHHPREPRAPREPREPRAPRARREPAAPPTPPTPPTQPNPGEAE